MWAEGGRHASTPAGLQQSALALDSCDPRLTCRLDREAATTLLSQPGILAPLPAAGRYLSFRLHPEADPSEALGALGRRSLGAEAVVGVGRTLIRRLGREIQGLRELPALAGPGVSSPSTPGALWCWLRGADPGALLHRGRELTAELAPAFVLEEARAAFKYAEGRDLSGYEDGTENPSDAAAERAAIVSGQGPGRDGASFVAVQRWVHDLDALASYSPTEQDAMIGRRRSDNEELVDAPASAHVKRTEQESFDPPAIVLRRSMPWAEGDAAGLLFVAFGRSLDAFELQLARMCGEEDELSDALFRFSRPVSGSSYWCPPLGPGGGLDLSALGL